MSLQHYGTGVSADTKPLCVINKWNTLVRRARQKGQEVDVTPLDLSDLLAKQNHRCALSGRWIGFNDDFNGSDTASVDRIDSRLGYIRGNIQWVHKTFNFLKNSLSQDIFRALCKEVVDRTEPQSYMTETNSDKRAEMTDLDFLTKISTNPNLGVVTPQRLHYTQIQQLIQYAQSNGPFGIPVEVTTGLARELLAHNPDNRPLNAASIAKYAEDMRKGQWQLNGEMIALSTDGELNNGQNRLHGCLRADTSFPTMIGFGFERETRFTVDIGRKRTNGNFLSMQGYTDTNNLARACRVVLCYDRFRKIDDQPGHWVSPQEIMAFIQDNPVIEDTKTLARGVNKSTHLSVGLAQGLYYIFHRIDAGMAQQFFEKTRDGYNLDPDSAILRLRNSLNEANSKNSRPKTEWLAGITIKAWNSFRANEPVKLLRYGNINKYTQLAEKFPLAR